MNPVNIQRDGLYCKLDDSVLITWSAEVVNTASTFKASSAGVALVDYAEMTANNKAVVSLTGFYRRGAGILIQQPVGDRTPYRVKARAGSTGGHTEWFLGIGYAPASPTGTDDDIEEPVYLPFSKELDELVIIENLADGHALKDRALCFAILVQAPAAGAGDYWTGQLSVQNLGVKPPTMQNAVS